MDQVPNVSEKIDKLVAGLLADPNRLDLKLKLLLLLKDNKKKPK